jgi:hypothetical protein
VAPRLSVVCMAAEMALALSPTPRDNVLLTQVSSLALLPVLGAWVGKVAWPADASHH